MQLSKDISTGLTTSQQLIVLLLLAFGLNFNTLFHEYALDDAVVLTGNTLVQKGVAGIPEILSHELFYGLEKQESDLSGGRYRPFALIVFALEVQFFGINPFVSHLINVLLFVFLIALLFRLLQKYIFRELNPNLAFLTCLLFVVHPIHTEVIANVKSRDELIAFILLLLSAFSILRYLKNRKLLSLLPAAFCFFISLLTRESAIPFIGIVPLIAYFFYNQSIKKALLLSIPLFSIFILYMIIRISVVGLSHSTDRDVLNSPFILATASEAFATKIFLLARYIGLLFLPYPLTFDYGYNQIPYIDFGSVSFIFSAILLVALVIISLLTFKTRSLLSFCILFFFLTLFPFTNFIMDIGAPLAERLLFQPSLAFCILFSAYFLNTIPSKKILSFTIFWSVLLLFSTYTVVRNMDWKNNDTLFFADVETVPNSVRANLYAAKQYILKSKKETDKALKDEYFKKAIFYDERILQIYPHCKFIYEDLGFAYFGLLNYLKAAELWKKASILEPSSTSAKKRTQMISDVLYNEGNKFFRAANYAAAITYYTKSVELNENNADAWYNLGGAYFKTKDIKNGLEAWQMVTLLDPGRELKMEQFQGKE